MFGIGAQELIIILIIVLIIFGAGKLPEIGSALGRGIKNFKKSVKENDEITDQSSKKEDEKK
jgi:sec-independent protein translocase protein TatA